MTVFQTAPEDWFPVDGDTFVTKEGFIFNVFGYEHPSNRVFAFLKYVPAKFRGLFNVSFLERTWNFGKMKLYRAEKLYTAANYQGFLEAFRKSFPDYVYFCPFRGKEVISIPIRSIKKVFVPWKRLQALRKLESKDDLQKMTLDFVELLSRESGISMDDFGVHGSVALNMHSSKSDIDVVVYGAGNFRRMEKTVERLVRNKTLTYQANNRLDAARHFKGRFRDRIFMYNAIRRPEEIQSKYGAFKYSPIKLIQFRCRVKDDVEAMFRPAIYKVANYEPANIMSRLPESEVPELVVSMVGCYRNVARQGDEFKVSGMLERVEHVETGDVFYQAVVGTGTSEEESICPP